MNLKEKSAVLVVDDHPVNRMIFEKMLKECGVQVEEAADGRTAVQMVREKKYDVVFLDCIMPEWDGVRTAQEIRALPGRESRPVIVAVSGERLPEKEAALLQAGVAELLVKPVTRLQLQKYLPEMTVTAAREERKNIALQKAIYHTLQEQLMGLQNHTTGTEQLIHICHTLKGLLATIGETQLSADFGDLLSMLRSRQWQEYEQTLPETAEGLQELLRKQKETLAAVSEPDEKPCCDERGPKEENSTEQKDSAKVLTYLHTKEADLLEAFRLFDYERILQLLEELIQGSDGAERKTLKECRSLTEQFQYDASKERFLSLLAKH